MLYIHVTHSFISGSAVAEEGWRPCLQHLYGDSGRERRTGCLGPSDVSLPFTSASGESSSPRHKELWVSSDHHILSFPQEPHIGAEGMQGAGLSPEQLRLLQRFRPELSWDQRGTAAPLPHRANRDTIGFFIAKFLKTWPGGMFSSSRASRRELPCLYCAADMLRWGGVDKRRSCFCLATAALWKLRAM